MAQDLRLMCILAHPDDESLGIGFTLARYAAEGVKISLVTATRGERGWAGNEADNPGLEALGKIREKELARAAAKLNLAEVVYLNYIDGEVDQADPREAAEKIAGEVRRFRPQVVIVFDPWGVYGHPDHIATTQYAQAGLLLAADARFHDSWERAPFQVEKLYYQADTEALVEAVKAVAGGIEFEVDGTRRYHLGWPLWALSARIDGTAHWDQVMEAIACHESQVADLLDGLKSIPEKFGAEVFAVQYFYRVFSLVNGGRVLEDDLFQGLRRPPGFIPRS